MAVTGVAVDRIRELIVSGVLQPGDRLPQENELAAELGISRNSMREAVRALEQARVLSVRHGSGTFVTSLEPALLLQGIAFAVDMLRDDTLLEVLEVRELLEPAATRLATMRMTPAKLARIREVFERHQADLPIEELVRCDLEFHAAIVEAADNATLSSILDGLSSRTVRQRIWGGIVGENAVELTIDYHRRILEAIESGNPTVAEAAALVHVAAARTWLTDRRESNDRAATAPARKAPRAIA
jgi:GntR family transcriptional repressor for pyruvate dehydrogenase complex